MISQNIKQKLKMQGVLKLWITFSLYFVGFNCQGKLQDIPFRR